MTATMRYKLTQVTGKTKLVAISILSMMALSLGSALAYSDSYTSGTIGPYTWTGQSNIQWYADNGGIVYYGGGYTYRVGVIFDWIQAFSHGNEWCGPFRIDTDWDFLGLTMSGSAVWGGGSGWAMLGECSWYIWNPKVVVASETEHDLGLAPYPASHGDSNAWELTPF